MIHQEELSKVWTLSAGLNSLAVFIAANAPGMHMRLRELSYRVQSGGPVARGGSSMAALTDGDQYDVREGVTERRVDATTIYFYAAAGDKLSITCRN